MLRFFALLLLGCLAWSCQRLPNVSAPSTSSSPGTGGTGNIVVPVSFSQWFFDSSVTLTVNDKHFALIVGSGNFSIAQPADGNVVITTTNPRGLQCVGPQAPIKADDAQRGVVIPCTAMLQFTMGQPASHVLGQADLTTNLVNNAPLATDMNLPWGLATERPDNPNWLFVADELFNRVLGFRLPVTLNQPAASIVLGQGGSMTGTANASSQATLSQPLGLTVDDDTFVVADANNNRILIYHTVPGDSNAIPDTVVGQPSFTTAGTGCDANSLAFPYAGVIAGGRLYVADKSNNRVLYWLTVPQGIAPPADGVIGQPTLTSCAAVTPPTPNTLSQPRTLHWDGNYLFIGDSSNNRVLVYQGPPDASSSPAYLIGQSDMASNAPSTADTGLSTPKGIVSDANTVFIADTYNNRILGYYRSAIVASTVGAPPHPYVALGQPSTAGHTAPDSVSSPTNTTLDQPSAMVVIGSQLFVSDSFNRRVLVFDSL